MKTALIISTVAAGLAITTWAGLTLRPTAFPAYPLRGGTVETIPLPQGLPVPVERYFRHLYGENVPVIKTVVITGRGRLRPFGVWLPARFRFIHEAGQDYRHYIETTFLGMPFMKINESFISGKERMEMPWGVEENNPKLDQGGALGMWAELLRWAPAVLVTDSQVHWEAVDAETAFLVVPFQGKEERFLLHFSPDGSKINYWEVMRYKNGQGEKTLWINGAWFDDGGPWAVFNAEEIIVNPKIELQKKGL